MAEDQPVVEVVVDALDGGPFVLLEDLGFLEDHVVAHASRLSQRPLGDFRRPWLVDVRRAAQAAGRHGPYGGLIVHGLGCFDDALGGLLGDVGLSPQHVGYRHGRHAGCGGYVFESDHWRFL